MLSLPAIPTFGDFSHKHLAYMLKMKAETLFLSTKCYRLFTLPFLYAQTF